MANKPSPSARILKSGARLVDGARQQTHGDKHKVHADIARLWTAYLSGARGVDAQLRPSDVAQMMALLKMGRSFAPGYHEDHYADEAVYAAIAGELREAEKSA